MFELFKKKLLHPFAVKGILGVNDEPASEFLFQKLNQAVEAIDLCISHGDLWMLSDKNVAWEKLMAIETSQSKENYDLFFRHVTECIDRRIKGASPAKFDPAIEGAWLAYYPHNALFEDVAIEETNGFFGSGDCPPPAFWTHVDKGVVVSFIPRRFIEIASVGVDICVNDTLVWKK